VNFRLLAFPCRYFTGLILSIFFYFLFLEFIPHGYSSDDEDRKPLLIDSELDVELVYSGLEQPTSMAFLGPDDILVLEKEKGTVQRITHGKMSEEPLIDLNVAYSHERGMLGIAVAETSSTNSFHKYIFLYFTLSQIDEDDDTLDQGYWVRNYVYRYELINDTKLLYPKLLLSTPPTNDTWHNGGKILIGPDSDLYVVIGDLTKFNTSKVQNVQNGALPDTTSGILRIPKDGSLPKGGILGSTYPLNLYYGYGLRNSFGIDFDPVTGKLWDTENGPYYGDEINLVEPGFNSGWSKVQGIWEPTENLTIGNTVLYPHDLVGFDGKGNYSAPEFIWKQPVGPTGIKFLTSDRYGDGYENDLFVGDVNNGYLYHFELNRDRNRLVLEDNLSDMVADTNNESEFKQIKFGEGFGEITDIQVGPYDGLLYVLSKNEGVIYRIIPPDTL
jgi:aldose sugar dehydrogenase